MHHPILNNIESIVFDLGEVIVDVDTLKTSTAFQALSGGGSNDFFSFSKQASFFNEFEKGHIGENDFRNALRNALQKDCTDDELDKAWNAMLGDTPVEKLHILLTLQKNYKIFALSNTNAIHIRFINDYLSLRKTGDCLENYFHHAYYSYQMGARKPDLEIYQIAIKQSSLVPDKTLMIDDRIENIDAAKKLGMQTFLLQSPNQFYDLFTP